MQLHCLYVYLWFLEESLYLLPIRIAIALFFFYSCYSSLMSCTILCLVVRAFCINLGILFLSEIILFPTWVKFHNYHKIHWLMHSFFLYYCSFFFSVYVSFWGGGVFLSSCLLCLLIHYYSLVYLFTATLLWLFFSLCIENKCELCPNDILNFHVFS